MPRISHRKQVIKQLEKLIKRRKVEAALRSLLHEDSDKANCFDDEIHDILDVTIQAGYESILSRRYLLDRKPYRKGNSRVVFERDLQEDDAEDGTPPWLTDDEFLQKYRMHRDSFKMIVSLINNHPAFQSKGKKPQAPVEHQLMVFLYYIGVSGSGASFPRCRQMFGVGRGTCNDYRKRVVAALRSLGDRVITWPDERERRKIARRFMTNYDFINCIAIADGTLFPLTYEPQTSDAPDYHGRKHQYSLTTMIVCDDKRKIRYYLAGFPGCVHDNRVYRNTELFQNPEAYFGSFYYLLSDSALTNSPTVVTSFKCATGHKLPIVEETFNTLLAKPRCISEHTIGMLKGRFQILKSIPMKITEKKKSVKRILRVIDCCIILHNLLIDRGDDEIPEDWLDDEDEDEEEEDPDESNVGILIGEYEFGNPIVQDDERRKRCMDYFKDMGMLN